MTDKNTAIATDPHSLQEFIIEDTTEITAPDEFDTQVDSPEEIEAMEQALAAALAAAQQD